jgi:hypothetical protein
MAYTHIWRGSQPASREEYNEIEPIVRNILDRYEDPKMWNREYPGLCGGCVENGLIVIWDEHETTYETFSVDILSCDALSGFCRTGLHDYDGAICETLLVLAAKIPGFRIDSDGFFDSPHGLFHVTKRLLNKEWTAAMENVRQEYGIKYEPGYRDGGNIVTFDVVVNGYSVLLGEDGEDIVAEERTPARSRRKVRPMPLGEKPFASL